ncbi:MAG: hypothetical protein JNK48_34535, partial [Bryobacterales bacterium]|nr:hypothetical protein [Bryobacterales bacterium]
MLSVNGYVLGLDLGVKSIGLALIDPAGEQIIHTAVRVFPAGVEGDFESGKDSSKNEKRRQARQARRQTERRARRRRKTYRILQDAGLLPTGPAAEVLKELDKRLASEFGPHPGHVYTLRAKALDEPLDPFSLGRILYHLAQRRGFLSNRRAPVKKDEELATQAVTIQGLRERIEGAGARTLGEYFARTNTSASDPSRIRGQLTFRTLYREEFEAIWSAQAMHHPKLLTNALGEQLREAI